MANFHTIKNQITLLERMNIPKELWFHEKVLVTSGKLRNIAHRNSRHIIFEGIPYELTEEIAVYRHMGDQELKHLIENNKLPNTQPYQTIVIGEEGLRYCKKYFGGRKIVDTNVTCIIEFVCNRDMIEDLFRRFSKAEDGCMSHGLGSKAGKTLSIFNESLVDGSTSFSPIYVRRLRK